MAGGHFSLRPLPEAICGRGGGRRAPKENNALSVYQYLVADGAGAKGEDPKSARPELDKVSGLVRLCQSPSPMKAPHLHHADENERAHVKQ